MEKETERGRTVKTTSIGQKKSKKSQNTILQTTEKETEKEAEFLRLSIVRYNQKGKRAEFV